MAITTVDIDKALLEEAKEALGVDTVRLTVDHALREAVMRRRQTQAIEGLASLDLDPDATKVTVPAPGE